MRVLAVDTTTREGSVALVVDDRIVDQRRGDAARTHADRLPNEILAVAAAHGLAMSDIDLFAVASGPGSFTGLRIGIATMQGFAFTMGRGLATVSALEALAVAGGAELASGSLVGAWMDAHRGEVFAALYRMGTAPAFEPGGLVEIEGPTVGNPADTLERWLEWSGGSRRISFLGDGAALYAELIERSDVRRCDLISAPPLAGAIGRMALARARRGETTTPGSVQPLYVRRPDAELERERKALRHQGE